jgi:hypothetical protein
MGSDNIRRLKLEAILPKPKKTYSIPKKSKKRIKMEMDAVVNDESLDKWFEKRRKELVGRCKHCGKKSCKDNDEYFKFSIAHILPKSIFESVATHPKNFIELCFWENSCHTNFDNGIIGLTDLNCFDEVVEKFQEMYPFITKEERRRIPPVLMNYIEVDL